MIKKLKNYLTYQFLKLIKPEIIGQYQPGSHSLPRHVGKSNMSHISHPENLFLGNGVFIGHFNYIDCLIKTSIGDGTQFSNFISVLNHSSHNEVRFIQPRGIDESKRFGLITGEVKIGKRCFIGAHSVIMPGSEIGDGCIVAAYSYVNGKFPDFSVIKGAPARVVGDTREIDAELLKQHPEWKEAHYFSQKGNGD
jgi:acetyltransferase-like isoleucine patch superfamily enzyme